MLAQEMFLATLYYINSNIFNCYKIATRIKLCLLLTYISLYRVKKGNTYLNIRIDVNILIDRLLLFNLQLNYNYTNLYNLDPYQGSALCIFILGGIYSTQLLNNTKPINPKLISLPYGASIANSTTKQYSYQFTYILYKLL